MDAILSWLDRQVLEGARNERRLFIFGAVCAFFLALGTVLLLTAKLDLVLQARWENEIQSEPGVHVYSFDGDRIAKMLEPGQKVSVEIDGVASGGRVLDVEGKRGHRRIAVQFDPAVNPKARAVTIELGNPRLFQLLLEHDDR